MFRVSKFGGQRRAREQGYLLIVLLLSVALLSVAFLGWIQKVDFEIKRDREEEMIHRGVQYSRAVSKFVRKFRRYPTSVQELERTNNIRFLRKRYKDPITGKDFKVLHINDIPSFTNGGGAGTPVADVVSQQQTANRTSRNVASRISGPATDNAEGEASALNRQSSGSEPSPDTQGDVSQDASPTDQDGSNAPEKPDANQALALPPNATGWVIGVASTSKAKTMRVFNKQDHYNQWKFIYDPGTDHAGILTTPSQPPLSVGFQPNQQQSEQVAPQAFGADSGQANTLPGSARGQQ